MTAKDQTAGYVELSSQTYNLFVDAFATANKRALEYTKSVWEIVSRPYASTAVETAVRENFDRANQIVSLTIAEMQTNGQQAAEFNEKLVAHGAKVQESLVHAMKGVAETSISNMNYMKESATQQFDDMTKRFEEAQNRTAAAVSQN
jgi:hypothetical protein